MIQNIWVIGAVPPGLSPGTKGAHWTDVWTRPDITMLTLREEAAAQEASPPRPYHLICTALNLPGTNSAKLLSL